MISLASVLLALFGCLSIVGGTIGFKKAGSRASLIAGGVSGLLLLLASALIFSGQTTWGLVLGALVSFLLAARFVPALLKTRAWMPQGVMAIFSILSLLVCALALV